MRVFIAVLTAVLALTGCEYEEIERETGYKGKARLNPWLAAERFVDRMGDEVISVIAWTEPQPGDSAWLMPASMLGNESFVRRVETWVQEGGHLILLVEHADAETNDWSGHYSKPIIEPVLSEMLGRASIQLTESDHVSASSIRFMGEGYQVEANSAFNVKLGLEKPGVFASAKVNGGQLMVSCIVMPCRSMRSRGLRSSRLNSRPGLLFHAAQKR